MAPVRLGRWFTNFAARNGAPIRIEATAEGLRAEAANGALAHCEVPFVASWDPLAAGDDPVAAAGRHACAERTVGVLLVRLGGGAAGVFQGTKLLDSKIETRHVQGRSAAGGWSQQRFARRRANQSEQALEAAADAAVRVLIPAIGELEALVLGGERKAVAGVLADRRLAKLTGIPVEPRFLTVPDPRQGVLLSTPEQFRAIRIRIVGSDHQDDQKVAGSAQGDYNDS